LKNDEVVYTKNLKGLWLLIRASIIIIQYRWHDFIWKGISIFNNFIVSLWYGITIKRLGFIFKEDFVREYGEFFRKEKFNYDIIISFSKINRLLISASLLVPSYKVKITGFPRENWLIMEKAQLPDDLHGVYLSLNSKLNGR